MKRLSIVLAALLALLLLLAIRQLYILRFQVGDVYPPYSSLRADPLGTKALFASLQNLPGLSVSRAYQDPEPIGRSARRTLFVLGIPASLNVSDEDMRQLQSLAASGDRIVISFLPLQERPEPNLATTPSPTPDPSSHVNPAEEKTAMGRQMSEHFGCDFAYLKLEEHEALQATATSPNLEANVPWNSLLFFVPLKTGWRSLYQVDGRPVIVERRYGGGSIVLLSDSYLFSNEALREHLSPRFLTALIDGAQQVVFDETVHGLAENPGIASLIRKYRIEPVLVFAAILAGLFAWQNMSPLVPITSAGDFAKNSEVTGRGSIAGRVNLLRRSVPPAALMDQCLRLWEKSHGRRLAHDPQLLEKIRAQADAQDPLPQKYKFITDLLDRERHSAIRHV